MKEDELERDQRKLELERTKLEREKAEFEQKKLQRVTIAVSFVAVLVSGMQAVVAWKQAGAATRQADAASEQADTAGTLAKLNKAQTLEKFISHLQNPNTRSTAILVMDQISDHDLVLKLAESVKDTTAISQLSEKGSPANMKEAENILDELAKKRGALIERMFGKDKTDRIAATTELQSNWRADPTSA